MIVIGPLAVMLLLAFAALGALGALWLVLTCVIVLLAIVANVALTSIGSLAIALTLLLPSTIRLGVIRFRRCSPDGQTREVGCLEHQRRWIIR